MNISYEQDAGKGDKDIHKVSFMRLSDDRQLNEKSNITHCESQKILPEMFHPHANKIQVV